MSGPPGDRAPPPAVRAARAADLPAIVEVYNQAITGTVATFDTEPKTVEDQRGWFASHGGRHPILVAVGGDGGVLGWAALSPWSDRCAYSGTAETSLYVREDARGRGVGKALMGALMDAARAGGLHSLLARITEGNVASAVLHERHGFRRAGRMRQVGEKFGRRLDVELWEFLVGAATPPTVTASRLAADLRALGVAAGDCVMLHAAVGQVGHVLGGPDVVLRALFGVLGPAGTLMMYTSWESTPYHLERLSPEARAQAEAEWPAFDPATSPANRGHSILAEYLRTWPGARRSPHPEGGMTAVGGRAGWLTAVHPRRFGYGPGTPLARFTEAGGKVLMLGAPLETVTLLHYAEHLADLPDKRVVRYRMPVLEGGARVWVECEEYDTGRPPVPYQGEDYFRIICREALAAGEGREGRVGAARSYLFPARELVARGVAWLEANLGGGRG